MRRNRVLHRARRQLRRGLRWLWAQEGSAGQRARGLAVGVLFGCFPFFGLQIVISVAISGLVRGNHLLAAAGTLVSNPLTYVPLYWFNYIVGNWLLPEPLSPTDLSTISAGSLWDQGWDFTARLLLGSSLVGAVLALGVGLGSYRMFKTAPRRKAALN